VALTLAACGGGPETVPAEQASSATTEPVAAVAALAKHLHEGDLLGFARTALPPKEYQHLQETWGSEGNFWPLTELPLKDQWIPLLASLAAPGSEQRLRRSFDAQFLGASAELRDAARTLGLFGVQYLNHNFEYSEQEREHYVQIMKAAADWGMHAPLADPVLAYAAIPRLAAAARAVGLYSEADFRAAGMEQTLRRVAPFITEIKRVVADYGLDLDQAYAGIRLQLVDQHDNTALVRVRYPLAGHTIDTVLDLVRIDGHWYLDGYLQRARAAIEQRPFGGEVPPILTLPVPEPDPSAGR
jgi:hypothetical protein